MWTKSCTVLFLSLVLHVACKSEDSKKELNSGDLDSTPYQVSKVSAEEMGCWGNTYEVNGTLAITKLIIGPYEVSGHYITSRGTRVSSKGTVEGDSPANRRVKWETGGEGFLLNEYALQKDSDGLLKLNTSSKTYTKMAGECYDNETLIPLPEFGLSIEAGIENSRPDLVTLKLVAPPAHDMYLTSSPDCSDGGEWEPYLEEKSWNLPNTDGYHSVFVKFRDDIGRESYCASGYYRRDTTPPDDVIVTINQGFVPSLSLRNELTIQSTESEDFYITNTPGCNSDGTKSRNMLKYPSSIRRTHTVLWDFSGDTVYVKGIDLFGNSGPCIAASVSLQGLYSDIAAMNRGTTTTPTGKALEYVFANGASGNKVWKEQGGFRVLRANGADEWAKNLNLNGKGLTTIDFVDPNLGTSNSLIAGRACPPQVYFDDNTPLSTQNCLYYTRSFPPQKLNAAGESQTNSGSIGLGSWSLYTNGPSDRRWYVGNIEKCSMYGMRLPSAFEIYRQDAYTIWSAPETNPIPITANLMGVPAESNAWTATSAKLSYASNLADAYHAYGLTTETYDKSLPVVCVLP